MSNIYDNHTLHGVGIGIATYYLMNKNGSKDALKYGIVLGGLSMFYMNRWGHTTDGFTAGQNMFSDFNRELAELTGT